MFLLFDRGHRHYPVPVPVPVAFVVVTVDLERGPQLLEHGGKQRGGHHCGEVHPAGRHRRNHRPVGVPDGRRSARQTPPRPSARRGRATTRATVTQTPGQRTAGLLMCGVAGWVGPELDQQWLASPSSSCGTAGQTTTGPSPGPPTASRLVGLAHTRLAIIDLGPRSTTARRARTVDTTWSTTVRSTTTSSCGPSSKRPVSIFTRGPTPKWCCAPWPAGDPRR